MSLIWRRAEDSSALLAHPETIHSRPGFLAKPVRERRDKARKTGSTVLLLVALVLVLTACRRENPAIKREATAQAARHLTAQAVPSPTSTPSTQAAATAAPAAAPAASSKQARIDAGNLGIGVAGVSAGIQIWSKPGGVMAGGATMSGTVADGTTVDVLAEEQFLGQKYYQIRSGSTSGWVEARFIKLP